MWTVSLLGLIIISYFLLYWPQLTRGRTSYPMSDALHRALLRAQENSERNDIEYSGVIDVNKQTITVADGDTNDSSIFFEPYTFHTHHNVRDRMGQVVQDFPGHKDFALIAKLSHQMRKPVLHVIVTPHYLFVIQVSPQLWDRIRSYWTPFTLYGKFERDLEAIYKNNSDDLERYIAAARNYGFLVTKAPKHSLVDLESWATLI